MVCLATEEIVMWFDPAYLIEIPWLVFVVYWVISSFRLNKMQRREPGGQQLGRIIVGAVAFFLLYSDDPRFGVLNRRFLPQRYWILGIGSALTFAGIGFAIWARYHIGRYWSSTVSLRAEHELIRTGPYARIRHPIYTGILLAVIGTALGIGCYRALVAFVIMLLAFTWKARKEEALLAGQFGSAFEEHRSHTGFFLPRVS
jgi:protein-S-isoprenylcysteine O-methyltransferase Ste14